MQFKSFSNSISVVSLLVTLFCSCITILTVRSIIRACVSPLRHQPGPFWARFSRLWYLSKVWRGDFEKTNIELHKKYGPVVRIAPNEYSIDDPDALKTIYGHGTSFVKAPWYYASGNPDPNSHDLFTDRDPKRHAVTRRKVAALYSMTSLLQMESCVAECTDVIVQKLTIFAQTGQPINVQQWMQFYAFDLIGLITLDKRFGFLDHGEDQGGLLVALHKYLIYCANVGIYSEWHPIMSKIVGWLPGPGMSFLAKFTGECIQERIQGSSADKRHGSTNDHNFLTQVLRMHAEEPERFTMMDVFTTCITNIGAGSDTTSISLSSVLLNLIRNPDTLRKLRAELDEKYAAGELSSPATFQEAQKLPFLQACIKEGLRIHPVTGLPLARVVPKGGAFLAGQFFPEMTVVGVNSWVAHSNTMVFGEDAGIYRPERWLESPERASQMERYFMTFGQGSRTCIGKNISLMEISKLIPELLRRFIFELTDPEAPLQTQNVWFVKQMNFHCRVGLRRI